MGVVQSRLKRELTSQRRYVKCLPNTPYVPFPEKLHPPGEDGLVAEFKVFNYLSTSRRAPPEFPDDTFWWVDAQFLPYNDGELVIASSAFQPRIIHAWANVKHVPQGRILVFDLTHFPIKGYILTGTQCPVYPKVQPHPLGVAVGYAGVGEVRVDSVDGEEVYTKPRDMDNRSQRFCAISPNGANLAVISRSCGFYFLEMFQLDISFIILQKPTPCHRLSPGFVSSPSHNEHVECKWMPDGSHLAVSSSAGKLFIVDKQFSCCVADIFPDVIEGKLSTAGAFDFNPCLSVSILAVGTTDGLLMLIDIDTHSQKKTVLQQLDTEDYIDCIQYSQDGTSLAVSFRTFQVRVYNSEDLSTLHTIDMTNVIPSEASDFQNQMSANQPCVQRLSFSFDGRHLATSSCDGYVRVWSVPRRLTLQEWCRKSILQHMPVASVRNSSLPNKVKQFLLSECL